MISLRICGIPKSPPKLGPQIENPQIAKRTGSANCHICGVSAIPTNFESQDMRFVELFF